MLLLRNERANSSKAESIKRDFYRALWENDNNHTLYKRKGEQMNTDLRLALTTTVAALLMIVAFSFTAIMH